MGWGWSAAQPVGWSVSLLSALGILYSSPLKTTPHWKSAHRKQEGSPFCYSLAVSLQSSLLTKPNTKLTGKREMFTESKFHVTKQDKEWI